MKTKLVAAQFLAILFTCGACASAIATEAEENVTFNSATVTLAKAVEITEKNGGKTIGAEFDIEKGQPVWENEQPRGKPRGINTKFKTADLKSASRHKWRGIGPEVIKI